MKVENKLLSELIPYEKNTKKHDKKQIQNVAESIKQYGFVQPVVIDKDGVVVIGHCRILAAQKLKMKEVPCVCVEDLTPEQVKALRIVDNKTNESEWIDHILSIELPDIDLSHFDFGINFMGEEEKEIQHEINQEETQKSVENILNLGKGQYYSHNKYDMPELEPVYELPDIKEWIGFNYVLSDENPEGKAVHFFVDDYQFERVWNHPEKYLEKLKQYVCVATPDFSPYGDMPLITQMWNHYRKHWVGAWLQEHGVTVIPTIRASTDPRSKEWYLDGEPHNGIVCISSMWTKTEEQKQIFEEEYSTMKEVLNPCKIFLYGNKTDAIKESDNIEIIKTFSQERWESNG